LSEGANDLLESIVDVFNRFDLNHDGMIEPAELWLVLRTLNPTTFRSETIPSAGRDLFRTINTDQSGQISVREFVMWILGEPDPLTMVNALTTRPVPPAAEL
jgi:Ca2+-binding EF-hand superfamily protein